MDNEEKQGKFYYLAYKRSHSKDLHEEIVKEKNLLDAVLGPLDFIREKCKCDFFVGSAQDAVIAALQRELDDIASLNPDYTPSDFQADLNTVIYDYEKAVPTQYQNCALSELYAVDFVDESGEYHLFIAKDPLELVQDVFAGIKDADMLEIHEISEIEAKKIQDRLIYQREARKSGLSK